LILSVIIPTLNEQSNIERLLAELAAQKGIDAEIIVADGGSTDATRQIVKASTALLATTDAGRGRQMNAGAEAASGIYLLFLHADSSLCQPHQLADAISMMEHTSGESIAGHYRMVFDTDDSGLHRSLRYYEEKTCLNRPGTWNGDQGLMIERKLFRLIGGFSERHAFLEDQEFGRRFQSVGRFITFPDTIRTSARRFEQEGFKGRVILNTLIMGMFELRLDAFFESAPAIYQANGGGRLTLLPFFRLVRKSVFNQGALTGFARCYAIGRYATQNLWQLSFWRGLKSGTQDRALKRHDQYVRPLLYNPVGYFLSCLIIVIWFHLTELVLLTDRTAPE
jgi:rSAM/selenodomain-associated transferase 2